MQTINLKIDDAFFPYFKAIDIIGGARRYLEIVK